jgi:pimeloyl-ACP methyl ester carboxylesterase
VLALEHLLDGMDAVRRAEYDAVPGSLDAMAAAMVDSVTAGIAGVTRDIELQIEPPDIDLADITCPVRLWYGSLDTTAPPSFGRWLADHLSDATLEVIEGAGHGLVLPRWEAILRELTTYR